jgi:hypothetical protein
MEVGLLGESARSGVPWETSGCGVGVGGGRGKGWLPWVECDVGDVLGDGGEAGGDGSVADEVEVDGTGRSSRRRRGAGGGRTGVEGRLRTAGLPFGRTDSCRSHPAGQPGPDAWLSGRPVPTACRMTAPIV